MKRWKRLGYYLMINVLVSACTTVAVLAMWDRARGPAEAEPNSAALAQTTLTPALTLSAAAGLGGQPSQSTSAVPEPTQAEPTEEPEPVLEPGVELVEYQVQAGDTLGGIAVEFDVSVAEILEASNLEDADTLEVGQVLLIPQPVEVAIEPERTALPEEELETPPATGDTTATQPPAGPGGVAIETVIGAGDLASERVKLARTGPGELSLAGWQLLEEDGAVFTFPQLNLFEGGAVNLYTRSGQSTVVELYWGLDAPVWDSGETVVLLDANGNVHTTYRVP